MEGLFQPMHLLLLVVLVPIGVMAFLIWRFLWNKGDKNY